MTNLYNLPDVMARLPVLQKAALNAINISCDAVDFWPYTQEGFPYWWNRIDGMTVDRDTLDTEDAELHVYSVPMALVIAHLTADGFKGETSHNAYGYIVGVLDYLRRFEAQHLYDGTQYRTAPNGLWIENGGALITGIPNGTRVLSNSGLGSVQQVAVVFQLSIPLLFENY